MVSWKSADESLADVDLDDYVLRGQIDAIDAVRDLLEVKSVHAIGYCVAGTTLAATLACLHAKKQEKKVASATFLTAQVDFSLAGDLKLFTGEETMALLDQLTKEKGYLDGRYMAATFNLLRGRDLIWNYVVNNYLLGEEPPPFDLLHWNSDTTNLPAKWHRAYLEDLYKGNKLAQKGGIHVAGTPIDIGKVKTPGLYPGGREDHIAPPESVWKIMDHFQGEKRFVLAGSGHIAGVVNPPAAQKYCNIGSTTAVRHARQLRRGRDRAQGQLVARLDRMAEDAGSEDGEGRGRAHSGRRASSRRSRTRPGAMSKRAEGAEPRQATSLHHGGKKKLFYRTFGKSWMVQLIDQEKVRCVPACRQSSHKSRRGG
jgi:poly(3-hydroxyalkanoate) synthetase